MTDETRRRYTKRVRAQLEEETRLRITESAVQMHGTVGPARTTMSALAERAGVTRSTLYRHFPDEAAVFEACSAHWIATNPRPDPGRWAGLEDPDERARAALDDLYSYYAQTGSMLANLLRDEQTMDVVRDRFQGYHQFVDWIADTLVDGRGLRGHAKRRTRAAAGHAVAFRTWQSLTEQGMSSGEAARAMAAFVASAA